MVYRTSMHSEISSHVRSMIMEGILVPGQRVPEQKLCHQMKVSRTPFREAMRSLASEGLVILQPNRGVIVKPVRTWDIRNHYSVLRALSQMLVTSMGDELRDQELTTARSHSLSQLIDELANACQESQKLNAIMLLHQMMASFSNNSYLRPLICQETNHIRQAYSQIEVTEWRFKEIIFELNSCVGNLADGDGQRLAKALDDHNCNSADFLLAHLKPENQ